MTVEMSESGSSGSSRAEPPQWPSAPATQRTAAEKARILAHLTVQLAALDMESRGSNGDH
jgi:hypothetical protein